MGVRHERPGRGDDLSAGELRVRGPQHDQRRDRDPRRRRWRGSYKGYVIFYVGVPNVEAALQKAESLGGTRRMGPEKNPEANLVVGHFTDPEGHLIGLAGPA
jgi:hypothetical protein